MYQTTEKSTTFGNRTIFSSRVHFRLPNVNLGSIVDIFSELASQLYPTGRAFYTLKNSIKEKVHLAINTSFIRLIEDAKLTLDSCFADNNNFLENDCALWEYRFGMRTNLDLDVTTRRQAIFRRMSRGRNIQARQHISYIEYQLQLAGFNVFLHENGFLESGIIVFKRPQDILYLMPENVQHGGSTQHGVGVQHGGVSSDIIANSFKANEFFSVEDEYLWASFFIGGETLGTTAEIPENRLEEFRELVLKLKPAHLVAFTFINYV